MKFASLCVFTYACFAHAIEAQQSHVITFFIKAAPELQQKSLEKLFHEPSKMTRHYIKKQLERLYTMGIYVTYAGYITSSDYNGQIILPRKDIHDTVDIIITPIISPVALTRNTIQHFEINPKEKYEIYVLTREHNKQENYFYWSVVHGALKSNAIPWNTIVIFADPNVISIPLGTYVTEGGPNLVLPSLLSSKEIHTSTEALRLLKNNRYFAPIKLTYQFTHDRYAAMLK